MCCWLGRFSRSQRTCIICIAQSVSRMRCDEVYVNICTRRSPRVHHRCARPHIRTHTHTHTLAAFDEIVLIMNERRTFTLRFGRVCLGLVPTSIYFISKCIQTYACRAVAMWRGRRFSIHLKDLMMWKYVAHALTHSVFMLNLKRKLVGAFVPAAPHIHLDHTRWPSRRNHDDDTEIVKL